MTPKYSLGMDELTSLSLSERILISSSYLSSFSEYCENNKHSLREVVATRTDVYKTMTYL